MKKFLLSASLLILVSVPAMAQKSSFKEVIDSSMTMTAVYCSSITATLMDSTVTVAGMPLRTFVAFQNFDTTNPVAINSTAGMSYTSGSLKVPENLGLISIPAALLKVGTQPQKTINLWCLAAPSASVRISTVTFVQGF